MKILRATIQQAVERTTIYQFMKCWLQGFQLIAIQGLRIEKITF